MLCYSPLVNYHIVRLSLTPIYPPIYTSFVSSHLWTFLMQISFLENVTKTWDSFNPPPLYWLRQNPDFFSKNFEFGSPLRLSAREETKSHRLHLFDFSPLCISKCLLKLAAIEDEKSHWLNFFTFLHCAFLNVSSNCLPERMKSHIGCICLTFLRCVFLNVSSNDLSEKRRS